MDKRWNYDFAVVRALEDALDRASSLEAEVVYINELKERLYTDDWLFLLRYLKKNMEKSKQWN